MQNISIDIYMNNEKEKKNQINKIINKNINLGIEILRVYLSFSVIVLHFLKNEYKKNIFMKLIFHCQPFYVPSFFLIAFYFSFNIFISKNIVKIKERFIKILIPYILWPFLFWIWNIFANRKIIKFNYKLFKHIFLQILIGYDFYAYFWFLFDLIIITFVFIIIIFIFNKNALIILKILAIFFYIINEKYEERMCKYKQNDSIKLLLRSFIYCLTGFFLHSISILERLQNKKYLIYTLLFPVICFIGVHKILIKISIRFKIIIIDIVIVCLFIVFSLISFSTIKKDIIKKIIKQLTCFTGGIYYNHYFVKNIFSNYFKIFTIGNFKSCLINYIVCYNICFIGTTIFRNSKLKYLFL